MQPLPLQACWSKSKVLVTLSNGGAHCAGHFICAVCTPVILRTPWEALILVNLMKTRFIEVTEGLV
jgi:hypothetical protein